MTPKITAEANKSRSDNKEFHAGKIQLALDFFVESGKLRYHTLSSGKNWPFTNLTVEALQQGWYTIKNSEQDYIRTLVKNGWNIMYESSYLTREWQKYEKLFIPLISV